MRDYSLPFLGFIMMTGIYLQHVDKLTWSKQRSLNGKFECFNAKSGDKSMSQFGTANRMFSRNSLQHFLKQTRGVLRLFTKGFILVYEWPPSPSSRECPAQVRPEENRHVPCLKAFLQLLLASNRKYFGGHGESMPKKGYLDFLLTHPPRDS